MRPPSIYALAATALLLCACDSAKRDEGTGSRFAAVKKEASGGAAAAFCEKEWPAGAGARRYVEIPERPLPGPVAAAASGGRWKWVNLWATWCLPCVEEMGLLARWKELVAKDGIAVDLELWSIDDDEAKLREYVAATAMPGRVRWLRGQDDLPAVLESLGAQKSAAIPIHALVDASGNLRCLRVGSVHDEDYGAVKTLLSGG